MWDRPPCAESVHERFFGLVRPDGTVKPHARAMQQFAATRPTVQLATRTVALDLSPDDYYRDAYAHAARLYKAFRSDG